MSKRHMASWCTQSIEVFITQHGSDTQPFGFLKYDAALECPVHVGKVSVSLDYVLDM